MRFQSLYTCTVVLFVACADFAFSQSAIQRNTTAIDTQGGLEPVRVTEVATAEVGVVRQLLVRPGDVVEAGMPLGRLDAEQQRVALKEAEAEAFAVGTVETARREVDFNRRRVEQTQPLVEQGKASPRELERFQLELNIAEAKLRSQQEAKQISQARLEKAQLAFQERTIRAPHEGVVVEVYREPGEYIAGNAPSFVKLLDLSQLRASFMLPEQLAEKFRNRTEAEIRLPNHVVVKGKIEYIAPFADAEGRTIGMTVLIDNPDGNIRSAHCELVP